MDQEDENSFRDFRTTISLAAVNLSQDDQVLICSNSASVPFSHLQEMLHTMWDAVESSPAATDDLRETVAGYLMRLEDSDFSVADIEAPILEAVTRECVRSSGHVSYGRMTAATFCRMVTLMELVRLS